MASAHGSADERTQDSPGAVSGGWKQSKPRGLHALLDAREGRFGAFSQLRGAPASEGTHKRAFYAAAHCAALRHSINCAARPAGVDSQNEREHLCHEGDSMSMHVSISAATAARSASFERRFGPSDTACWSFKRVYLNVGGVRHEVLWSTLERYPGTRLGRLACKKFDSLLDVCDDFDISKSEFFFDHYTDVFPSIISYYRSGKLHLIGDLCYADLPGALDYWGLHDSLLEPCCARKYLAFKDNLTLNMDEEPESDPDEVHHFGPGKLAKYQFVLWRTLEQPTSSMVAKVWGGMSIFFIIVSTCMLVLGTTKWFQDVMDSLYTPLRSPNCTARNLSNFTCGNSTCDFHCDEDEETDHPLISGVEMICIIWFTLEFVLRFCATPNKKKFMTNTLNVIDLLSILPYYVAASISSYSHSLTSKFTTARKLLQLLRILRILRVFKIARHSTGLKALGFTVKQSYRELGMIVLFLVVGVLFFSTLCYYIEKDAPDTKFTSIPEAFWYTAISMTTVGYGDITPTTPVGKLVGIVCCLCGVLVIALPIPIIVNSFTEYLTRQRRVERHQKRLAC